MSNAAVGAIYQTIIDEVIEASRADFEDGGVEEGVLEELKRGWQKKLSQLNVATFPWDPKPDPAAANNNNNPPANAPPANGAANFTQAQLSPTGNAQLMTAPSLPLPSMGQALNGAGVKPEPGMVKQETLVKLEPDALPTSMPAAIPFPPGSGGAAARAVQQLQNTFGQRAAASISAIQGVGAGQPPHHGILGQGPQGPRPAGPQQVNTAQQYRAQMAAAHQQQQQRIQHAAGINGTNGLANSQVDGCADAYEGVLMQRDADGGQVELGRVEIDRLLHEQMLAKAKQMEGGGLMLPLKQAAKHKSTSTAKSAGNGMSQVDGGDDDYVKNEDDDLINSDLDDPEDDKDEDDDDEDSMGPIMLCMYDKVQRVKNKWKCTLKDGVLTVNGKEYVFHKATGEYEW